MTPADPSELAEALRRAGLAEVDAGIRRRAEYSSDASNYRVVPAVVAFPRHADEAIAALSVAREQGAALTCRGGGTSIAGNAVGSGIVLDFSRHLNRVLSVDPEEQVAIAEPGAVLDQITLTAGPHGLRFGPDPSTHARATIGGSIGNNACGARSLRYGRTSDAVRALEVITGGGVRLAARQYGHDEPALAAREAALVGAVGELVDAHLGMIRTEFGRFRRQVSGYSMEHLLPEHGRNLARFLVGTEGTLAVMLRATVHLVQTPPAVALAVLGYSDMVAAADAVPALLPHQPVALEGMDARLADVVRGRRGVSAVPDLPRGGGWLFVETAGETDAAARAAAEKLIADADSLDAAVVTGAPAAALWRIREDGAGLGGRTPAGQPAWPGWEDAAVPPEQLAAYLREFGGLLSAHGLDALVYGHFGEGCVHARIDFPLAAHPERFSEFVVAAAAAGRRARRLAVRRARRRAGAGGAAALHVLARGPGRVRSAEARLRSRRRAQPRGARRPGAGRRRPAVAGGAHDGARSRVRLPARRRRPVHRRAPVRRCRQVPCRHHGVRRRDVPVLPRHPRREGLHAWPGASAAGAGQRLAGSGFRCRRSRRSRSTCACPARAARADCPAGVDMATYKAEVLYQRYRRRLRPRGALRAGLAAALGRARRTCPSARQRRCCGGERLGRLAKRAGGIDARRPLPQFAPQTFRAWFADRPAVPATAARPVLLWVDTFTDHFTPQVGQAAVRVLEHAGYQVQLTDKPVCCGLTWISTGQLDGARRQLRRTPRRARSRRWHRACRSSGSSRPAPRCCGRDVAELLPDDPARGPGRRGDPHARRAARPRPPAGCRRAWTASPAVAQPHCHQHAVLGWDGRRRAARRRGAQVDAGRRLLRAGRQLRGRARATTRCRVAVAETALLPAVRERAARRRGPRRRLLLPHPARAARRRAQPCTSPSCSPTDCTAMSTGRTSRSTRIEQR